MNPNGKVSLKWRVWIGIVLIVMIFGNVDSYNLGPRIHELQSSMEQLERKIGQLEYKLEEQTSTLETVMRDAKKTGPTGE